MTHGAKNSQASSAGPPTEKPAEQRKVRVLENKNKKLENELVSLKKELFFGVAEAKMHVDGLEAKIDSLSLALAGVMKKNRRNAYNDEMESAETMDEAMAAMDKYNGGKDELFPWMKTAR